ncbi:hypothetical protein GIB67_029702 [Kingdonia uniflora]|uniref:Uncharacterized protein n=1 Tax=Kingdonia uniflora TaxID=39325 RepID=A0A7J7LLP4_9MAGN|nr:hypothetical protein GIB67_029702 [Kingdonia uniflora]
MFSSKGSSCFLHFHPKKRSKTPQTPSKSLSSHNPSLSTLPLVEGLPLNAESSTDIPITKAQHLKKAFDGLEPQVSTFLTKAKPDWVVFDYAPHWLPSLASNLDIPCVYFSLFNAANLAFIGPPWALLSNEEARTRLEDFTVVPKWVTIPSNIVYRVHELLQYFKGAQQNVSGVTDIYRFGVTIRDCEFVALRSCDEFEPEWIKVLTDLYKKPVIPIGSLHPTLQDREIKSEDEENKWFEISEWLDKHKPESVVYIALGSEATLTRQQINELALGLERSELPFYWVLRQTPESTNEVLDMLPIGFEERIMGRGMVCTSWVPQVRILGHKSVGGFLTHCGWNSVIEALGYGRVLILLPIMNDQGLNSRLLERKKLGLEIPRNDLDGSFTNESVTESLKIVMVEKEGNAFRKKAREMAEVFGDKKRMNGYINNFVEYLKQHRHCRIF